MTSSMEEQITAGLEFAATEGHTHTNVCSEPAIFDDTAGGSHGLWVARVASIARPLGWRVICAWEALEGTDRITNILLECVNPDDAATTVDKDAMQ